MKGKLAMKLRENPTLIDKLSEPMPAETLGAIPATRRPDWNLDEELARLKEMKLKPRKGRKAGGEK